MKFNVKINISSQNESLETLIIMDTNSPLLTTKSMPCRTGTDNLPFT